MIVSGSIVKIQGRLAGSATVVTHGTGSVVHSRRDKAIIMTAAHVVNGLGRLQNLSWRNIEVARRQMEYDVHFLGIEESFAGKYLCVPEHDYPDIGLIEVDNLRESIFPAIPVSLADRPAEKVAVYGFARGIFTQQKMVLAVTGFSGGEKFPCITVLGDVPFGFSGGPMINNGEIQGIVFQSSSSKNIIKTLGVHSVGIRRMITNWAAGKYVSFPYGLWEERGLLENGLPEITHLPVDIRSRLGAV
jgi:hypothetical protein